MKSPSGYLPVKCSPFGTARSMQALRKTTGSSPAGRKLLQLLQQAANRDELAKAVLAVLSEGNAAVPKSCPAAGEDSWADAVAADLRAGDSAGLDTAGAAHAAAPQAAMSTALSTVPDLQFITPRSALLACCSSSPVGAHPIQRVQSRMLRRGGRTEVSCWASISPSPR